MGEGVEEGEGGGSGEHVQAAVGRGGEEELRG